MLYPKNISEKLGFDDVVEASLKCCESELGKQHFSRLKFSSKPDLVNLWLEQTNEVSIILSKGELPLSVSLDFDLQSKAARISGFFYEIEIVQNIQDVLRVLERVDKYFDDQEKEYPQLSALFSSIDIDYQLIEQIDQVIGPDGDVKSSASPALSKIINNISKSERSIIKSSNSLFVTAKEKGFLADTELGIKNGRVVLPVLSEYKRKVNGVLIDQSGTGKISYIEPLELVTLNNELAELHIKKRQEIVAILKELTAKLVIYLDDIRSGIQKLGVYDFIRAKARIALEWKCTMPILVGSTEARVAFHPLLAERLKEEGKTAVPLDYTFDREQRLVVISGPNAGGKSVALKTVGLIQYMLQNGFLVPCASESKFQLFDKIFVDIGDNQSIESDLSTYSSHLKAAKHIINFSDDSTLVLMDEIGTGTDPMFGGPMAEAVLEQIHKNKAYGIITTHFSNIKNKADKLKGVVNAAMLFDIENLIPLYKLQIGQPGSSFVYEVAANIGLNKKLIKRAKELTDTKQYDLDVLLAEVQGQQEKIRVEQHELTNKLAHAEHVEEEYRKLKELLDIQKKQILSQANQKADALIKDANKEIEKTIRTIKESKADKVKTQKVREKLASKATLPPNATTKESIGYNFKIGDNVQLIDSNTVGEVVEIKKNKVTLQIGGIITKTSMDKLVKVGQQTAKKVKKYISESSYNDKQTSFRNDVDVRGMRTYEALSEIDTLLDSAIILNVASLRVLHGKGNGILRTEIRRHLKSHPSIDKISYERVDLGGEGISIIQLK
jgi:DNA mismatch repair protein MutS2